METPAVEGLRAQAESLASLSIAHLSPSTRLKLVCDELALTDSSSSTRLKLVCDELSVNAYPTDCGGLVYVGAPCYRMPAEADLAAIFTVADQAGIAWLKFDSEAAVIDGLPVFDLQEPEA